MYHSISGQKESALDALNGEKVYKETGRAGGGAQKGGRCSPEIRMLVLTGVGAYRPTLSAELSLPLLLLDLCCSL